ncbi:MAG: ROK family protein [Phototrophicaceae bacterium]|jgi:glucokinase
MNGKATKGDIRRHNRAMVLRAVYTGTATNRAALSVETELTKPAISDLVSALINEGLLLEEGFGEVGEAGGKRPRLLRFLPNAAQVIGVAIHTYRVLGLLTTLDGDILVEHQAELTNQHPSEVFNTLIEVIHALLAQCDAPLLCISVGVSALIDLNNGIVQHAPRLGWFNWPLGAQLADRFSVPVYISNSTELATRAQIAYGGRAGVEHLAAVLVNNNIGVGSAHLPSGYHTGNDIGHLMLGGNGQTLEEQLGWSAVRERALVLGRDHASPYLNDPMMTYLTVRYAAAMGDAAALALQRELSKTLAQIYTWVITLIRPDHLVLAGAIGNLGEPFLAQVIAETQACIVPDLFQAVQFSIDDTDNLVALGAVAKALQEELGLIYG